MTVNAIVVAHSKNELYGDELITIEIELHRFVLPEFNTHRVISRNFQSSRALNLSKQRKMVAEHTAFPVYWGLERPGMQASEEMKGFRLALAKGSWWLASRLALGMHKWFSFLGVHKQVTNRLLEPFMYTKGLTTATKEGWDAFLALRAHQEAQPEIQALAYKIKEAIEQSTPKSLQIGEYHIPYGQQIDRMFPVLSNQDKAIVGTSLAAQVSYRIANFSLEKAHEIYKKLRLDGKDGPAHASPTEHIAIASHSISMAGNFGSHKPTHFVQYRKSLKI